MPIKSFLNGTELDRKTTRIMDAAFKTTLTALGLVDRPDLANEVVARRILELVNQGERNPELLRDRALESLREDYLRHSPSPDRDPSAPEASSA
jgi:hypothetical protein